MFWETLLLVNQNYVQVLETFVEIFVFDEQSALNI